MFETIPVVRYEFEREASSDGYRLPVLDSGTRSKAIRVMVMGSIPGTSISLGPNSIIAGGLFKVIGIRY